MTEKIVSPEICVFTDENLETLNIQIELPGVDKNNIDLRFYEDGFYVLAKREDTKYMKPFRIDQAKGGEGWVLCENVCITPADMPTGEPLLKEKVQMRSMSGFGE
jgi:hypothetical protein